MLWNALSCAIRLSSRSRTLAGAPGWFRKYARTSRTLDGMSVRSSDDTRCSVANGRPAIEQTTYLPAAIENVRKDRRAREQRLQQRVGCAARGGRLPLPARAISQSAPVA